MESHLLSNEAFTGKDGPRLRLWQHHPPAPTPSSADTSSCPILAPCTHCLSRAPRGWQRSQRALTSQPCPLSSLQGQELTIRQISLLGFRDLVLLKVKLGDSLLLAQSQPPSSIVQMLLILQVGEGPTGAVAAGRGEGETPRGGREGPHDLGTLAVLVGSRSVWPFVFLSARVGLLCVRWAPVRPLGLCSMPGFQWWARASTAGACPGSRHPASSPASHEPQVTRAH